MAAIKTLHLQASQNELAEPYEYIKWIETPSSIIAKSQLRRDFENYAVTIRAAIFRSAIQIA